MPSLPDAYTYGAFSTLRLVRLEVFDEQIEHFLVHAHRIRARPVDLVDDDDRRTPKREGFAQYEAGLWHRTVESINHQQHTIDHAQNALHFTAEIGVTGSVDDIQLGAVPADRGVLRQDRDATLALERTVESITRSATTLILTKGTGLSEHLVDERSSLP